MSEELDPFVCTECLGQTIYLEPNAKKLKEDLPSITSQKSLDEIERIISTDCEIIEFIQGTRSFERCRSFKYTYGILNDLDFQKKIGSKIMDLFDFKSLIDFDVLEKDIIPNSLIFAISKLRNCCWEEASIIFSEGEAGDKEQIRIWREQYLKSGYKYYESLSKSEKTRLNSRVKSSMTKTNNVLFK